MDINPKIVLAIIIASATIIRESLENDDKQLLDLQKTLKLKNKSQGKPHVKKYRTKTKCKTNVR